MNVDKIMSKSIVTVGMDDSLAQIKELFDSNNFHHLLVVDAMKLFGVISDRDLLKVMSPNVGTPAETARDAATLNKKAHQILTRKPITLLPTSDFYEAVEIFKQHKISCIPVVNNEGKPVGIISWRDIIKAIRLKPAD
tara:strand:+ start:154069 stop:154482 length:414 start_codon:yes stop_codon:yes gene_type:complete